MPPTYTAVEIHLANAASDIDNAQQRYDQAVALVTQVDNLLGGLGSTYAADIAEIDALLVANPTDAACMTLHARKDRILADGVALKATTAAAKAALAGV